MAASPKSKFKQMPIDVWSTRERLCLASSVMRSGDQNWMSVSRAIRPYSEPNRPQDWFSQKNCALQYSDLLEKVETPKRKRGERSEIETPGECIVRKLTQERIEELKKMILEEQPEYYRLKDELQQVASGEADGRLKEIWTTILEEKRQSEIKEENHIKWLQEREAAKQAAALELRNRKFSTNSKAPVFKRSSTSRQGTSDHEADSVGESPVADSTIPDVFKEEPSTTHEVENTLTSSSFISSVIATAISSVSTTVAMPSTTISSTHHHSPLLNTLLRSSTHVSQSITLPKDTCVTSPTISSLLSSSPIVTSTSVANLLTTALASLHENSDVPSTTRSPVTSPSQGAPTLLKLLDAPVCSSGKLPPLPIFFSTLETTPLPTAAPAQNNLEHNIVKEEPPIVKPEQHVEEIDDVVIVQNAESLGETIIDIEQLNTSDDVSTARENIGDEKSERNESIVEDNNVEVVESVSAEPSDREDVPVIIDFQEVCTETTSSEVVYTEEVETESVEEPSSSSGNIICTEIVTSGSEEVELVEVTSTNDVVTEDVVTTTIETVLAKEETIVESVLEVKTELETTEPKEQDLTKDIELIEEQAKVEVLHSPSPIKLELEKSEIVDVKIEPTSAAPTSEEVVTESVVDVVESVVEEKKATASEEISALGQSAVIDASDTSNTGEEKPRRRSRSKKWALGISERVARRTSSRTAAGHSTSPAHEESTPEVKVENTSFSQISTKKPFKKEVESSPKQKRETDADEESISKQNPRSRRSNLKRAVDINTERKGKVRSRRHLKHFGRVKSDDDEVEDERKGKEIVKIEKKLEVEEDSKENTDKDEVINYGSSEMTSNEMEEESKEGVVIARTLPTDSVPNSPASTSFSGDDVESMRDYKTWKKAIMLVWRSVANHKYANVFLNAVTDEMAPGYQSVVYRPMDLATVKKNIENQTVRTTTEFQRDVLLIFQNAIMYNSSDHDVYKMAVEMQQEVIRHIQDFVATQLMVQSNSLSKSLRRETRDHALKTRESMEKSLLTIMQDENKRKRPASEGDSGNVHVSKRRRTRANDD